MGKSNEKLKTKNGSNSAIYFAPYWGWTKSCARMIRPPLVNTNKHYGFNHGFVSVLGFGAFRNHPQNVLTQFDAFPHPRPTGWVLRPFLPPPPPPAPPSPPTRQTGRSGVGRAASSPRCGRPFAARGAWPRSVLRVLSPSFLFASLGVGLFCHRRRRTPRGFVFFWFSPPTAESYGISVQGSGLGQLSGRVLEGS